MQDFNCDNWKNLATSSPLAFELHRRMALQDVVDSSPAVHQPALSALLETLCAPQQGTNLERAIHAQSLMLESLAYLKAGWEVLLDETAEGSALGHALLNAQIQLSPMRWPSLSHGSSNRP